MPGPSLRRSVFLLGLLTVLGGFVGIVQPYSADPASGATSGAIASDRTELERYQPSAEELRSPYQRPRPGQARGGVYKDQIMPHWFHNDTRFWYRNNLRGGAKEFILVDAEAGARKPAFDHQKLAAADQDPYLIHYYRVNFDGTDLVALTEGNGHHSITYAPDRKYLIDKYDRIDLAPVHELRRVSDGKLVCELEKADDSELRAGGWEPPEVFVAKGRDGKTDIWGIICRPRNFDPNKKYPVIENIYAGPQGSFVPKRWSTTRPYSNLTDLGFIVAKIDGMGTANRSKAFHDVCWKNLKDAGFPDRILWHQAAAKKYAYYDISRVGIYGTSAGGQNSTGGVLFHPEFYKVAVSGSGCHDNRMDKASWNEQWMGYLVGPHYAESSNVDNARRLRGKLLLIVGELDKNVPPESTLRVADALIREGKDFDYLVVPNAGHGSGGAYGARRMQDFFVRHLHGVEPPDRNGAVRGEGE